MNAIALMILAAALEVGGDAMIRAGLKNQGAAMMLLGSAVLVAYGFLINLTRLDFGRLMGIYIVVFFIAAQGVAVLFFKERLPLPMLVGGLLIIAGGLVMTLWRVAQVVPPEFDKILRCISRRKDGTIRGVNASAGKSDIIPKTGLLTDFLGYVGQTSLTQARKLLKMMGLVMALAVAGLRPRTWKRTVRSALVRQILSSGVEAVGIISFLAISLGVLLMVQYQAWVAKVIQTRLLAPVVVVVVVRELGPILVNVIAIARSGNAISTELGLMHVTGEIRVLEGQGIDPLTYLILPRVFGLVISVFCLTLIFDAFAFLGVYFAGQWLGASTGSVGEFARTVMESLGTADFVNFILKSSIPPLLAGAICCNEGLNAGENLSEVPHAARIAVQRSVVILFVICALISIGTYT